MKNGWGANPLTDEKVFSFRNGLWKGKKQPFLSAGVLRSTNFRNDGILDYSDVALLDVEQKAFEKRRLSKGDIIIERSGGGPTQPVGRVGYFDKNDGAFSFSNFTSSLHVEDKSLFLPKFVHYFLLDFHWRGETEKLQNRTTGIRNLDFTNYKKTVIPRPPLPEQRKIVTVLAKIQRAVELQEATIANVRELKKSLMHRLFTHGLRGEKLKQTEIGKLPCSWEVKPIGEQCQKPEYGFTASAQSDKTATKFLRITDITDSGVDWATVPYCDCPDAVFAKLQLKDGDILFARIGATTGKSFLVKNPPKAVFASYLIRVRPLDSVNAEYLYYFFNSTEYWRQVNAEKGASLKQGVNGSMLAKMRFPLPKKDEQVEIANTLRMLDVKLTVHETKKSALQDLFKTTLNQLMTGVVRVADLDIDTSEVGAE